MMLRLLNFLYLDGYESLWFKYFDNSTITKEQHDFVVAHRDKFYDYLFKNHKFDICLEFRKARRKNDWDKMLYLMLNDLNERDFI